MLLDESTAGDVTVCKITPRVKTAVLAIIPSRRPRRSAIGAAAKAPKKVPAESRETMVDDWLGVTSRLPSSGFRYPVEKVSRQYGMARMPPMVPVS